MMAVRMATAFSRNNSKKGSRNLKMNIPHIRWRSGFLMLVF